MGCDEVEALSAELALGVADAQERAAVVEHLETCAACRSRLRSLSEVAEELIGLAPPEEPPAGFESRVLGAIGDGRDLAPPASPAPPPPARIPRRRSWSAAAAAAVVLAAGAGGWAVGNAGVSGTSPTRTSAAAQAESATLFSGSPGHHRVGEVLMAKGSEPWISVAVQEGSGRGTVHCEVAGPHSPLATVGTFSVSGGYGYWASSLPAGMSVRTVRLVLPDGQVMATASLR